MCCAQALSFDVRRGSQAVGTAVRDAACYVLWTMARGFQTPDLEPFSAQLQVHIVNASLFDREVQIRRASSSAFQEIVGRHVCDVLPARTLSIMLIRREESVSSWHLHFAAHEHVYGWAAPKGLPRCSCVHCQVRFSLDVPCGAQAILIPIDFSSYSEYRPPILDHLENSSLRHWDVEVRALAADALRSIYQGAASNMVSCLERLVRSTLSQPVCVSSLTERDRFSVHEPSRLTISASTELLLLWLACPAWQTRTRRLE